MLPTSFAQIQQKISAQLGQPVDHIFRKLESDSIAVASIGQVHRGQLINGQPVVVKVQHASIEKLINQDMLILETILRVYAKIDNSFDLQALLAEWKKQADLELDFLKEAKNQQRARNNMITAELPIIIPRVYMSLTTKQVMVQEYIEGFKINDLIQQKNNGIDLQTVFVSLLEAFCHQVFINGFYHADPHPGNILINVDPLTQEAKPVLLDWGLVKNISDSYRYGYCKFIISCATIDLLGLIDAMAHLGFEFKVMDQALPANPEIYLDLFKALLSTPNNNNTDLKLITKDQKKQMWKDYKIHIISQNSESSKIFLPIEEPLWNLIDSKDKILTLLEELPALWMHTNVETSNPSKAIAASSIVFGHNGGKLILCHGSPITDEEIIKKIPNSQIPLENSNDITNILRSRSKFCLTKRAILPHQHISLDVIIATNEPNIPGFADMGELASGTNGQLFYYQHFNPQLHYDQMIKDLSTYFASITGWEAALRARISTGWIVNAHHSFNTENSITNNSVSSVSGKVQSNNMVALKNEGKKLPILSNEDEEHSELNISSGLASNKSDWDYFSFPPTNKVSVPEPKLTNRPEITRPLDKAGRNLGFGQGLIHLFMELGNKFKNLNLITVHAKPSVKLATELYKKNDEPLNQNVKIKKQYNGDLFMPGSEVFNAKETSMLVQTKDSHKNSFIRN
uniref:Uncharacterized protein LOC113796735 n=1 Tax=Dermatophagoides pteronyssinus TaxID=6956 RepID=A0A6P6YDP3_DERPT|nr:uncharacterized protein LOC113796735 [Dermatophagoides pteronyssinus]